MNSQEYHEQLRLSEAKQLRKRAEDDARLLSNRIALLKQEELKAVKKIEETQRKAQEIIRAKVRSQEEQKKKDELKSKKQNEEGLKMQKNKQLREQIKGTKQQALHYRMSKAYHDSQLLKMAHEENTRKIEDVRAEELAHKVLMKNTVKRQHEEAEEKRKKMMEDKREKIRKEHEKKVEEENKRRREREEEVIRMEQEELELIQRLQNTQLLQKSAYEDLENVMSGFGDNYSNI